jgi:hypothetical protein
MTFNRSSFEINLSEPGSTNAKAKHIRKLNGKARSVLRDLDRCFDIGEHWDELSPVQKITFEEYTTGKLLELVDLYNRNVLRSIHYRLREKTPEEEEENVY